jgi:imidazolonepropionase-like amidohydrolase
MTLSRARLRPIKRASWIQLLFPMLTLFMGSLSAWGAGTTLVIEHVTVVPMTQDGPTLPDVSVVVQDGVITEIGPAGKMHVPATARRISGRGKWLMPGLADMHVHIISLGLVRLLHRTIPPDQMRTADLMLPFIANGVTQILDMASLPASLEQRDEIERGDALGPHYATAGEIDGPPAVWGPVAREVSTPEQARKAVYDIHQAGFDFIKVYSRLSLPCFTAIVDEGKREGIRVVGHLPNAAHGHIDSVLIDGLAMVAHAEEYAKQATNLGDQALSDREIQHDVALARQNHIWLTGTLTTMHWIYRETRDGVAPVEKNPNLKYMHPLLVDGWLHQNRFVQDATPARVVKFRQTVAFNDRLVRAFAHAGIPILAGTDASVAGVVWGFSLHDELEALAHAGLSNRQVLESSTRLAAQFLGVGDKRGTVEVGKQADLLLLDANPLKDVANTRRISAVIVRGRYYSRQRLDGMMADLAHRYGTMKLTPGARIGGIDVDD